MPIDIRIKNSQAIEDVSFQVKGFTCLVGKSNIGKSSVLRSVQSMFKNSGGLVRHGKDSCEVFYKDGSLDIHWTRGKENKYKINGKEYQTGREIPPPITDAGIKELVIGNSSTKQKIDVQTNGQHSPLFLINNNKREAAEIISAISRLDVISKASKECNRDLKQYKGKLKLRESDRDAVIQQLKKFERLEELKNSFNFPRSPFSLLSPSP